MGRALGGLLGLLQQGIELRQLSPLGLLIDHVKRGSFVSSREIGVNMQLGSGHGMKFGDSCLVRAQAY